MQLNFATNMAKKPPSNPYQVSCPNVQKQIDSLLLIVGKLREQCPGLTNDTFSIPVNPIDLSFALGRWKSTTPLESLDTGEPIEIVFDFYANGTGRITFAEQSGGLCEAELKIDLTAGKFNIDQLTEAMCSAGDSYNPYVFNCATSSTGQADCKGKNKIDKSNIIEFKLVRISQTTNL
jgi:hypothetical protein